MNRKVIAWILIFITTIIISFWGIKKNISAQIIPSPINGQCGSLHLLMTAIDNIYPNTNNYYCQQWETDNILYHIWPTQYWTRDCKWVHGWTNSSCQYNWTPATNILASYCWSSHAKSFSTTISNIGDNYSNINNNFLESLCTSGSISILPESFSENALGRSRSCPWAINACNATRYKNALCGISANTWHTSEPISNLCAPWSIASPVIFDNQTHLWSRSCNGNGGGTMASCSAWLQGPNNFSPICNTSLIQAPNWTHPYTHITGFPWNNWCIYGTLQNRQLSVGWTGTRQCTNNGQTAQCGNIQVANAWINIGDSCNNSVNNKSYDYSYQLFTHSLCTNGWLPWSFTTMNDRWRRTCWLQNCEATMTTQSMCWWATKQPRKTHPTQWVCNEWIASTIKSSTTEWGWICTTNATNIQQFNNSICNNISCVLNVLDFYNGKTAVCTSPRIVDGQCKWQTQLHPWFSSPDQVLQAWLCETGIPDTLIPTQDFINKKWKRTCKSTNNLWINSPTCYANVKLPNISVLYNPQISNNVITSVAAFLTWFDPIYITFDNPVGQYYRLFTQNWSFFFQYHDWAGNTWNALAVVDNIQNDLPTATIVYSPSTSTSGNVIVSLTWFNRLQTPNITFTGSCLILGHCIKNSSYNPYLFAVTYNQNTTGTSTGSFILVDNNWVTNKIDVTVTNIDRTKPTAQIQYSNINPTNTSVTATIINPSEPITVTNNNNQISYTFSWNWVFPFSIIDKAGNITILTASVNRINKNAPSATVVYSTTGNTKNNVIATLTNFSTPGTLVTNNSWKISYTFTHNTEFVFLLKDPAGNVWSVVAKVKNIDKPIAYEISNDYNSKLCPNKTPTPKDTQAQIYNYYIQTVINNCVMKSLKAKNNYRYFYPRKWISRWEFITAVGRMITLTTNYSWSLVNTLSPNYIQTNFIGIDESSIGDADARWLLIYSPLIKNNTTWQTDLKKVIGATEAKAILGDALKIMNNTTDIRYLIKNKGNLTKAQAAYALWTILSQYNNTALWDNHIFLETLNTKLSTIPTHEKRKTFVLDLIKKVQKTSSKSLSKLAIHPDIIIQDLKAIALWTTLPRKYPTIIDLQTTIDSMIRPNNEATLPINNNNKTYTNNFFNFWEWL